MPAIACFDTSVLLKRYLDESGSRAARDALRRFRPVCSAIVQVEMASAIVRRARAGEISERRASAALNRLSADSASWELIDVEDRVLLRARLLIRQLSLATLDALHIASALVFVGEARRSVPFVTADARQRDAAVRAELDVVWVT